MVVPPFPEGTPKVIANTLLAPAVVPPTVTFVDLIYVRGCFFDCNARRSRFVGPNEVALDQCIRLIVNVKSRIKQVSLGFALSADD